MWLEISTFERQRSINTLLHKQNKPCVLYYPTTEIKWHGCVRAGGKMRRASNQNPSGD